MLGLRIGARRVEEERNDFLVRSGPCVDTAMDTGVRFVPVGHTRMHRDTDLLVGISELVPWSRRPADRALSCRARCGDSFEAPKLQYLTLTRYDRNVLRPISCSPLSGGPLREPAMNLRFGQTRDLDDLPAGSLPRDDSSALHG